MQRLAGQLSWSSVFVPVAEVFQHHALGCHHSARDRAVRPEVVQEETTWSTVLRCENQAGAGLGKVAYQWARRDAGAQTEFSQRDRRQYTVSNVAHRLAHRCFNHTGSAPSSLSRAYPCGARGRLGERGLQLVRCRARRPSLAIRVGITRCVTSERYVVAPSSWPTFMFVPVRFHRCPVCRHACFRQNPSHECARSGDRFTTRVCQRLHSGGHVELRQSVERRRTDASDLGQNVRRDVPKPRQPGFFWRRPATLPSACQRQSGACGPSASGKRVRTASQSSAALKGKQKS